MKTDRNDVLIQTLHLHRPAGTPDGAGVRLPVERLLGSADLRPPGMPPAAVLLVRRLEDPQPGRLAAGFGAASINREWERRVRQALDAQYQHAAHPARGSPIPASAGAVCFADEGEALVCLLLDLRQGRAAYHWWWKALLSSAGIPAGRTSGLSSPAEMVEATARWMVQRARLVPAVLDQLEQSGQAGAVLQIFSGGQVERILRAVLDAFQLAALPPRRGVLGSTQSFDPKTGAPWQVKKPAFSPYPKIPDGSAYQARPDKGEALGREAVALLGLSFDLARRPAQVSSLAYRRRLRAWWLAAPEPDGERETARARAAKTGEPSPGRRKLDTRPHEGQDDQRLVEREEAADRLAGQSQPSRGRKPNVEADQLASPQASQPDSGEMPGSGEEEKGPPAVKCQVDGQNAPSDSAVARAQVPGKNPHPMTPEETFPGDSASPEEADGSQQETPAKALAAWLAGGVETKLGGVLYLVNLMHYLGLPQRYESGWRLASGVGAWGTLDALARVLCAARYAGLKDDPIWMALAQLDGREPDQPPGWRLPRSRPRRWPAFEVPADWLAGDVSARNFRSTPPAGRKTRYLKVSGRPLLDRWLTLAMPYINSRLRVALDLAENDAAPDAAVCENLLHLPGRLYISSSHIDLVAPLQRISLRVRYAGLDRDPGWAPDFGRVIYFHFE